MTKQAQTKITTEAQGLMKFAKQRALTLTQLESMTQCLMSWPEIAIDGTEYIMTIRAIEHNKYQCDDGCEFDTALKAIVHALVNIGSFLGYALTEEDL